MANSKSEIRVRNAERLAAMLRAIPKDIQEPVAKAFRNSATRLAKRAKTDVVKQTGDLSKSLEARQINNDEFRWKIVGNFYWKFIEFGTKKMSKKPFFMHHYRQLKKTLRNAIKRNVKKSIRNRG